MWLMIICRFKRRKTWVLFEICCFLEEDNAFLVKNKHLWVRTVVKQTTRVGADETYIRDGMQLDSSSADWYYTDYPHIVSFC